MSKVLMVINSTESGPRRAGEWLREAGIETVDVVAETTPLPENLDGFDGLVMLGGGLLPYEDENAPWLATERELARQAIDADLPTLGICLGGQLLAHVGGGEVRGEYGTPESGAVLITTTAAGRNDPVLGVLGEGAHMIENHVDQITQLPADAVLLGRSADVENQAFRIGKRVWGLQFHPEVNAERIAQWGESALGKKGFDREKLAAKARAVDGENTRASKALIDAFAEQVAQYAKGQR
ncbi:type 1 glutamine amidotransferase [Gulosibacter hominis]|uniref:type 1 glutamine amidotransferase n=1 Tax=Gulosibacter hominis TaxID=2770504 RepID=UPI001E37B3E8|nr:type 1 glutamine amidotransferase [Gulosibacter hominis]